MQVLLLHVGFLWVGWCYPGRGDPFMLKPVIASVWLYHLQEPVERVAVITLRSTRQQQRKKVVWTEDTVDNEHMNKKKSKCCCIYKKPRNFGESESDDSEDECEHCFGHVEARKLKQSEQTTTTEQETAAMEPTATLTLQPRGLEPAPPDDSPSSTD